MATPLESFIAGFSRTRSLTFVRNLSIDTPYKPQSHAHDRSSVLTLETNTRLAVVAGYRGSNLAERVYTAAACDEIKPL